jgi:hypothetical protein
VQKGYRDCTPSTVGWASSRAWPWQVACRETNSPAAHAEASDRGREVVLQDSSWPGVVRTIASVDFACPADGIRVDWLWRLKMSSGLEESFLLAHACGHDARYACPDTPSATYCFREPLDPTPPAQAR